MLALSSAGFIQAQTPVATPAPAPATPVAATPADEVVVLEEFQVKGLRGSAMKAIELKKNNIQFTDSVVSEDIGKFPDNNVIESLQRVPGIQVTDYGRGNITSITIRGLPDVVTLLNGRNIFTSSGLTLSLQDVPATLIKRIDVMKTRSASAIESGMAGVLNVETFRPFDFAGHRVSVSAKATYQEQRGAWDPNLSVLVSNRWKIGSEGKFGALFNASYLTTTYRDQSATSGAQVPFGKGVQAGHPWPESYARAFPDVVAWTPGLIDGLPTKPGSTIGNNVEYVLARDAVFFADSKGKTERPGATLSLQFSPHKNAEYTFDATYLGYRNRHRNNLFFTFTDWWLGGSNWMDPANLPRYNDVRLYPGTNIVQSRAYIPGIAQFTSSDYSDGRTDSFQYAIAGKWFITPAFTLTSELVYQDSKFERTNFFMRADRVGTGFPWLSNAIIGIQFNDGTGLPALINYDNPLTTNADESNLRDPNQWTVGHMWDGGGVDKGSATTFTEEGIVSLNWPFIKKLKLGLRVDDRRAASASRAGEGDPSSVLTLSDLNSRYPGILYTNSDFFDGRGRVPSSWVSMDASFIGKNSDKLRKFYNYTSTSTFDLKEVFSIDEVTTAGYVQADELSADIGGHKLTGQMGMRLVSIKTAMNFTNTNFGRFDRTQGTAGVTKWLPSAAFQFDITKKLIARAGYGQTIRRPAFNDLNPLITYNRDVTNIGYGTATGGNPNLKPTTSKSFDLALEYYFDQTSMVHIAAFKKNIDGLVVGAFQRVMYDIGDGRDLYPYILSAPINASNGKLDGIEMGGKFYPKFFKGFGVEASYTHLKSSQDIPVYDSTTGKITKVLNTEFFAVSPDSFSVTAGYERSFISARLSYAWRSSFHHHNEAALFANPLYVYNAAERSLTAQVTFKIAKDLSIDVEGTNLTDDIQRSYYGKNGSTVNNFGNWIVGRTFSVATRYSF
ncbi:MAG: TonB-dependent receptor [Nibricoccus sp.]